MIDRKAPGVSCASPDGLWHADNVVLACTASDLGAIVNSGTPRSRWSRRSPPASEDASAATDSRAVCDAAGNCTTAGPITGNKDRSRRRASAAHPRWCVWHGQTTCVLPARRATCGAGLANAWRRRVLAGHVWSPPARRTPMRAPTAVWFAMWRATAPQAGPIGGNKIDRKAPVITVTTPASGAVYQLHQVVSASYSCPDGGSGPATCAGTVPNLSRINTSTLGSKTFVVNATDAIGNASSSTVTYQVRRTLTAVGPVKVWIGLKNSDAVGLRLDLRAELLVDGTVAASGTLNNVSSGSSGFNNAILQSLGMSLASGPVDLPAGALVAMRVSVRRTCVAGGHNSGTARHGSMACRSTAARSGTRAAGSRPRSRGTPWAVFLRNGVRSRPAPGRSQQRNRSTPPSTAVRACPGAIRSCPSAHGARSCRKALCRRVPLSRVAAARDFWRAGATMVDWPDPSGPSPE